MKLPLLAVVLLLPVAASAQVDGSGTITTGSASQIVFQANTNRSYLECQNPVGATELLAVNTATAASLSGGSYEIAPGGSIRFAAPAFVPTGPVSVTAATAAHRFICKQF